MSAAACICPLCGGERDWSPRLATAGLKLARRERAMLDALIDKAPRKIGIGLLCDAMYADDPDGGPLDAARVAHLVKHRLRQKIAGAGLRIVSTRGPGAVYWIEREDAP